MAPGSTEGRWIPPGQPTTIGAHVIPGGLIYVGRQLGPSPGGVEPALVNPALPATAAGLPYVEPRPGPELAYHLLSPAARAAYLRWLADGRCTVVGDGLVLLFCFGLERRVLLDADPAVPADLPAILAEVRRLRARYGDGGQALRTTLDRLLELLEVLTAPRGAPPAGPDPAAGRAAVRVLLARCAAAAAPVPADLARAWVRCHPDLPPRGAQVRCPEEFERLFTLRYRARLAAGLVPPDDVPGIRLRYQPANPRLTTTLVCREDLPDVLGEPRSTRALGAIVEEVVAALDPYCRWLARFPQGRGSLVAATLLPSELVDSDRGRLGALRAWAEARLDDHPWAVVDGGEFAAFWPSATPDRMARDEAVALFAVLALVGIGVEPDVRFGGPALTPGPAVLFRLGRRAGDRPGARFLAAAAVARCAAAVASGPLDPRSPTGGAVLATIRELAALLRVPPGDDLRLVARACWLLTTGVPLDRLGRQTAGLDPADREVAGRYLLAVAEAADPAVGPATVGTLMRVYRILGLEPNLVFHRLHERSLGVPTVSASTPLGGDDEPVVVWSADAPASGYALPWAQHRPAAAGVVLDQDTIARKLAESVTASRILTSIFDPEPPTVDVTVVPGLDRAHSAVLRALTAQPSWTRDEFASLAARHGVLPDGAFDVLNEVALDTVGAPVIEDDATLAVNHGVLLELLA